MIQEKIKLTQLFKNLKKNDYITILLFLTGFIFATLDFDLMLTIKQYLITMQKWIFWITYFIMFAFLFLTLKLFIKNSASFRLKEDNKIVSFQSLKLFFLGYYLGFIVNVSNAFVMALFEKMFNIPTAIIVNG